MKPVLLNRENTGTGTATVRQNHCGTARIRQAWSPGREEGAEDSDGLRARGDGQTCVRSEVQPSTL